MSVRQIMLVSKQLALDLLPCLPLDGSDVLILHPEDRADERSVLEQIREFAAEKGIQFEVVADKKTADERILSLGPEFVFVCGWYWLIPTAVIEGVSKGVYGIHNSLLPKYRGGAPLVWSIMNGDETVGSSLFQLDGGMDTGRIAHQVEVPLTRRQAIADALQGIRAGYLKSLPVLWPSLAEGTTDLREQDTSTATYAAQRHPADGLIDWSQPAARVHDFIRAQSTPYPGAFFKLDGKEIAIERTREIEEYWHATPGQVIRASDAGALVGCGGGSALLVEEIKVEGAFVPANRLLKSNRQRLFPT